MGRFVLRLAWRYLRPVRREGFVSVITVFSIVGITLGVATLILVTSLMNGIREEMTRLFIGIDGHISIYPQSPLPMLDSVEFWEESGIQSQVKLATPKIEGQVMATAQGNAMGAQIVSWPTDALSKKPLLAEHLTKQTLEQLANGEGIVLGTRLAQNLRLKVGDAVTLISPQGRATFAGFVPRMKSYTVIDTIKLGMHLYDSSLIIMPFTEAQRYFQLENSPNPYSYLEVTIARASESSALAQQLSQQLGTDARIYDWQRSNATLFQALAIQRNVMVLILALIVLVAAFNIISSLIMLVQDKHTDIAILRTMGATKGQLMQVFCFSGTLIGALGTLLGLGLGTLLARHIESIKAVIERLSGQEILVEQIYFLSSLPTQTDPAEVVVIAVCAIGISFAATLYPAWRAASIAPAEALRYG